MIDMDVTLARAGFDLAVKLNLPPGTTAITGASGAGKTSLLRIIAGLEPAAKGHLHLQGETLMAPGKMVPPEARGLGVVFQESRLFPHLNVRENLLFSASDTSGLADIAGLLDLTPLLSRRVGGLSGGEARRVALGRAVLSGPRLLLLDEPLTGLDGKRRARIMRYIETLIDETGLSVVLVSHAWDEVLRLADYLAVMAHGRLCHHGPAQAVLADPNFAKTLGPGEARSLLTGEVLTVQDDMIAIGLGPEKLWIAKPEGARMGQKIKVAVMARDVTLALARPTQISTRSILPVTITRVDQGQTMTVSCRVGDQTVLAELTASAVAELGLHPGQEAFALIKATPFARGE